MSAALKSTQHDSQPAPKSAAILAKLRNTLFPIAYFRNAIKSNTITKPEKKGFMGSTFTATIGVLRWKIILLGVIAALVFQYSAIQHSKFTKTNYGAISASAISPDGKFIALSFENGLFEIRDTRSHEVTDSWTARGAHAHQMFIDDYGPQNTPRLIVATASGEVVLRDITNETPLIFKRPVPSSKFPIVMHHDSGSGRIWVAGEMFDGPFKGWIDQGIPDFNRDTMMPDTLRVNAIAMDDNGEAIWDEIDDTTPKEAPPGTPNFTVRAEVEAQELTPEYSYPVIRTLPKSWVVIRENDVQALGSDGQLYARFNSKSSVIEIFDTVTSDLLLRFKSPEGIITAMAFSPDNQQLALGYTNGVTNLLDIQERTLDIEIGNFDEPIKGLAFNGNGRFITIVDDNMFVETIDVETYDLLYGFEPGLIGKLRSRPNTNEFAVVTSSGIQFYDLDSEHAINKEATLIDLTSEFDDLNPSAFEFSFSPDGKLMIVTSRRGVEIWNINQRDIVKSETLLSFDSITALAVSNNAERWIVAYDSGLLTVWEQQNNQKKSYIIDGIWGTVTDIVMNSDNNTIVITTDSGVSQTISTAPCYDGIAAKTLDYMWVASPTSCLCGAAINEITQPKHICTAAPLTSAAFAPAADNPTVLIGRADGSAKLLRLPSGRTLAHYDGHSSAVSDVKWAFDADVALMTASDGSFQTLRVPNRVSLTGQIGHYLHFGRLMLSGFASNEAITEELTERPSQENKLIETESVNPEENICVGYMWLGQSGRFNVSSSLTELVFNPDTAQPGDIFYAQTAIKLREGAPQSDDAYLSKPQIGTIVSGVAVEYQGDRRDYNRQSGKQYWARVKAPIESCYRVYTQYRDPALGDAIGNIRSDLRESGFYVLPNELIDRASDGSEIRIFAEADRSIAQRLQASFNDSIVKHQTPILPIESINLLTIPTSESTSVRSLEVWVTGIKGERESSILTEATPNELCPDQYRNEVIYFEFDKSVSSETASIISRILDINPSCKIAKIEITGHTDSSGAAAYNITLSSRMADTVRREFISQGVDTAIITTQGKGETSLIIPTGDSVKEQLNRRVEVLMTLN